MPIPHTQLDEVAADSITATDTAILDSIDRSDARQATVKSLLAAGISLAELRTTPSGALLVPLLLANGDGTLTIYHATLASLVSGLAVATTTNNGIMTAEDKTIIDQNAFESRFIDGGRADSIYLETQNVDGGGALSVGDDDDG